jgi:hypothetical protein
MDRNTVRGRKTGWATMLKVIAGVSGVALLAGILVVIPGMTPVVQANTYSVKGDRLDMHSYGAACSERAWPYFEASCLRNTTTATRQATTVRLVTTDRLAAAH